MGIGRRGRPKGSVGKAAILSSADIRNAVSVVRRRTKNSSRDELLILMSIDLGLRATELSSVFCSDVFDSDGNVSKGMLVRRRVGCHFVALASERLRSALADFFEGHLSACQALDQLPLFRSQRSERLSPMSIAKLLTHLYREADVASGSSRSGRRTLLSRERKTN